MKIKTCSFPYQFDIKGNHFPLVPFTVIFKKKRKDFFALVDSGATISIFKSDVAERFGIEIEKGEEISMRGVSGWLRGYKHSLTIETAGKKFACPVVFSRDYLVPFNILGRNTFFEKFKITFDESQKRVILS